MQIRTKADPRQTKLVFERALKQFNRSYRLWYAYLRYRRKVLMNRPPTDPAYGELADAYERSLAFMNKVFIFHFPNFAFCFGSFEILNG
jgi:pre-mRNA-splicing factor SYF1